MKSLLTFISLFLLLAFLGCSDDEMNDNNDDTNTTLTTTNIMGTYCNYTQTTTTNNYTSESSWNCVAITSNNVILPEERRLIANGLPNHEVGTFPNLQNPNTISSQNINIKMHYSPNNSTESPQRVIGYALNGVPFDPNTAGTCNDSATTATKDTACSLVGGNGQWNIEAISANNTFDFGTDMNNAHVQPDGTYHYHGMPENYITRLLGTTTNVVLVGWALDGFPIYAKYGYTDPQDNNSAIKEISGSYQIKSSPDANRPSTTDFPMGVFQQDWEYVANSGDLDNCNGRTGVTPDFATAVYHYYITDTYPYIGRCLKGEILENGNDTPGPPPGGPGPIYNGPTAPTGPGPSY